HPKAAGGDRLTNGFRLVRAVDAIERRAQIQGPRAQRILDAAGHMTRQIGPPCQHLRGWRPAWPDLFRGNSVRAGPTKSVTTDAEAVPKRQPIGKNKIEPPFGRVDQDGAGRIRTVETYGLSRDRA